MTQGGKSFKDMALPLLLNIFKILVNCSITVYIILGQDRVVIHHLQGKRCSQTTWTSWDATYISYVPYRVHNR